MFGRGKFSKSSAIHQTNTIQIRGYILADVFIHKLFCQIFVHFRQTLLLWNFPATQYITLRFTTFSILIWSYIGT